MTSSSSSSDVEFAVLLLVSFLSRLHTRRHVRQTAGRETMMTISTIVEDVAACCFYLLLSAAKLKRRRIPHRRKNRRRYFQFIVSTLLRYRKELVGRPSLLNIILLTLHREVSQEKAQVRLEFNRSILILIITREFY